MHKDPGQNSFMCKDCKLSLSLFVFFKAVQGDLASAAGMGIKQSRRRFFCGFWQPFPSGRQNSARKRAEMMSIRHASNTY